MSAQVSAPAPAAAALDHEALLLAVVADKTGYPVDMLTLDMELEAGLGIDSIKRVEILSVLQEKIPQLAVVDTGELAALNTLGEIVDFAARATHSHPAAGAAVAPLIAAATAAPALRRLAVIPVETPASGLVTPGLLAADPLWLVGGEPAVASLLATRLTDAGIAVQRAQQPPADARAVMLLSGLDAIAHALAGPQKGGPAPALLNEILFSHLQCCAESMATRGQLLITVQATGGAFGLDGSAGEHAWSAGIVAAAKTAALEWPQVEVKAIDIEIGDVGIAASADGGFDSGEVEAIVDALLRELLTGGSQLEVGLKTDGRRVAPVAGVEFAPTAVVAQPSADGVIVVSGGARGVTAACLAELLTRTPVRLAILGRTPLREEPAGLNAFTTDAALKKALLQRCAASGETPTPQQLGAEVRAILAQRELTGNLDRFRALGGEVHYFAVDVGDADAVEATVAAIRQQVGPIQGLVHAAGVLADKEIRYKTIEQFRQVLHTKVEGFRHLLDATRQDALTHIACFSSVAARRGNVGQVDYAMANEVLNRVCQTERVRRGSRCLVKAIGWGPWAGGMVNAGLEKHFAAMGVALIPLAEGARLFADEFTGVNGDAAEIVFGGGLDSFGGGGGGGNDAAVAARHFDVRFHRSTHPWLVSHVIRGLPVVPMMAINDLALAAARAWLPDAAIAGTANIEVVKGLQLRHFETVGDVYRIECEPGRDAGLLALRLLDRTGAVHYRLDVLLGQSQQEPHLEPQPDSGHDELPLQPWQPASGAIYDGRLFHGPDLQVIEALEGISERGCAARLRSLAPWQNGQAPMDVLDGGLQLALLWVQEQLGRESLPTGLDALRLYRGWPLDEPVMCQAICTSRNALLTQWTLRFESVAGDLLATIHGLKVHLLPEAGASRGHSEALSADIA